MPYAAEGDPKTARIIFIGEAPSHVELMTGRPFTGPSGHIFNECLEQAGILRSDCFITNVFQEKIKKQRGKSTIYNDKGEILFQDGKHGFSALGMEHVKELEDQISNSEANVIVPLGGPAFRAICSQTRITKWRGSILKGVMKGVEGKKVIPTLHPANVIHGQYVMKYVITSDFRRVNRESKFPDVRRPPYRFKLRPTFAQCMEALEFMKTLNTYACDIEIGYVSEKADPMGQITRICFS